MVKLKDLQTGEETMVAFKSGSNQMALKMRPTGLGHGVYKDVPDYGVFCGEWCIGRIYRRALAPSPCAGFGRCTPLASQGRCGPRTKWRRWKWPRPSLRQAGNNGRRGRGLRIRFVGQLPDRQKAAGTNRRGRNRY